MTPCYGWLTALGTDRNCYRTGGFAPSHPLRAARGTTGLCIAHGGGRKCERDGCSTAARGSTPFCTAHGGGKRCTREGCR